MPNSSTKTLTIWSPVLIILVLFTIAFLAGNVLRVWVWVPIVLLYWFLMGVLISVNGGKTSVARWLAPSKSAWSWKGLALLLVLPILPAFLDNLHFYSEWWILLLTIVFAVINPWFEEAYWRGLLLDVTSKWPGWIGVWFSSVLFAVNHLTLGVHSIASRHPIAIIAIGFMGLVWGIVYQKTKSLRWVILGHFLVDMFNLTIPALLNLYVPPG